MSTLNQKIRAGLKKDPEALLDMLSLRTEDKSVLQSRLSSITGLLEQEKSVDKERKKLSRQIGAARKENKDPAAIIASVAELSASIKKHNAEIEEQVALIESDLVPEGGAEAVPTAPKHLYFSGRELDCDESSLTITHSDHINELEWQTFTASLGHSNVYHDAKWCALIKQNFGHMPHYITCRKSDGSLCGVLPTVHLKSRLFGSFMVSMPYFNYGGPLSEFPLVEEKMLQYAVDLGGTLDATHLEIRETQKRQGYLSKQHKVTMILPLPNTDQELDKQLGSKVRAQVNRAAKEDLHFSIGGAELLDDYYRVFSHNMRDLGTPVYSKRFFASILEDFPDKANLTIVKHNNEPVAAGFLLGHNDKLEIPWASSLRKANPLGANMFMYRHVLRTAVEQGYEFFDFGRSSKGASTYQYKKQWGAVEHPLYWHYWLKDGDELPELNPNNPKYKIVIKVWQKLPVAVANVVGPQLVRNLP